MRNETELDSLADPDMLYDMMRDLRDWENRINAEDDVRGKPCASGFTFTDD